MQSNLHNNKAEAIAAAVDAADDDICKNCKLRVFFGMRTKAGGLVKLNMVRELLGISFSNNYISPICWVFASRSRKV